MRKRVFDISTHRERIIAYRLALRLRYIYIALCVSAHKDIFGQIVVSRVAGLADIVELQIALDSIIRLETKARF